MMKMMEVALDFVIAAADSLKRIAATRFMLDAMSPLTNTRVVNLVSYR